MKCKQLVWDYKNGEIICIDNGEVVGKIYDYSPPRAMKSTAVKTKNTTHTRIKQMRHHRRSIMAYKEVLRLKEKLGDKYIVDEEKYIYQRTWEKGKIHYTIKHVKTIEVEQSLSNEDLQKINKGITMLEEKYPWILQRTIRTRYALGYMFYEYINKGKIPPKEEIIKKMKISLTTYKRLRHLLTQLVSQYSKI